MLQRNVSGYPLILPTLDPPVEIPNGGEFDFDEPLAGFEPVRSDPAEPEQQAEPEQAAAPDEPEQPAEAAPEPEQAVEPEQVPVDDTGSRRSRRGTDQQKDAPTEGA